MRLVLAGASGVIGRLLLPRLVGDGHRVTALTRNAEKVPALEAAGAEATVCDVLDAEGLRAAVTAARPEVVVQHLTDLPADLSARNVKRAYAENDRVRGEGTANLVAAAIEAGTRRYVAQTVSFFYAPEGGPVKDESAPLMVDDPPPFDRSLRVNRELEERVVGCERLEGLVLRFGLWYGPGTTFAADGYLANEVRRRRFPMVGDGTAVYSFVHVDDVCESTVAALTRGAAGVYNVCDDEPAPMSEWLPAYAAALGAKPPLRLPRWLVRLVGGSYGAFMGTEMRGADNGRAKRELGWSPAHPSWRRGFVEARG